MDINFDVTTLNTLLDFVDYGEAFIRRQNGPGILGQGGSCVYLNGRDGRRCAVGALMTWAEADKAQAYGGTVKHLAHRGKLPARLGPMLHVLDQMQRAHDGAGAMSNYSDDVPFMEGFTARMDKVRYDNGLPPYNEERAGRFFLEAEATA